MELISQLFTLLFVNPVTNGLLAVYQVLLAIRVPYALGFSIVLFTVIIRLLLSPLTVSQLKTSKKMQELNPQLAKLKEKHKGDAKRLQQETMLLYKQHGVNPLGGCIPALVQIVLFYALYTVLMAFVATDGSKTLAQFNKVTYFDFLKLERLGDSTFFGLPLGQSPSQLLSGTGFLIFLVPVLTGVFQLLQSKMMFPAKSEPSKDKQKTKEGTADFQSAMQTQMTYLIPVTIGIAAFNFPLGLSLYWNTFSIFAIMQQYQLQGLGGLSPWIERIAPGLKKK